MKKPVVRTLTPPRRSGEDADLWVRGFPDPLWRELKPLLTSLLWLCPPWLISLRVEYAENPDENIAQVSCKHEYGQATIEITAAFFLLEARCRRRTLIHELLHVALWPLSDFADKLAKHKAFDGGARTLVEESIRERMEGSIEHLTRAVEDRLADTEKKRPARKGRRR